MAFSSVGRKKISAQVAFLLVNIVVLALAARVNSFQDFFFVADLFPLCMAIITLVVLVVLLSLDFALDNSYTGRAQSEIAVYGVLSIFWLAFNAFSTARWRLIPFTCGAIPDEFAEERTWCKDIQALKSFVWINWLICFFIFTMTLRYSVAQYTRGNKHIFQTPLSRYEPELGATGSAFGRDSEFLQFEKIN
ncbi:hypothetical protein BDQ12DRAFT_685715 [Crucibulum laeve]|uniref:MARVEL domain-containing protein n=1 Tax=Crucibulum laeve TaxID=68775 RepID=A0A5C3LWD8_9AGAR|nr:hypothetical protein BDQ12DRAFT_685715 [Crucibulum laeve]